MKLIVGLGNPRPGDRAARHNSGWRVLEEVARRASIDLRDSRYFGRYGSGRVAGEEVGLLFPETYMNRSGRSVAAAVADLGSADLGSEATFPNLLVAVDDIDLPLGRLRLRRGGTDGGQRGLRDVIECLGTEAVPRLRFGVSRPPLGVDPVTWVLQDFSAADESTLRPAIARAADAVACFVSEGIEAAMDRFNRAAEDEAIDPA